MKAIQNSYRIFTLLLAAVVLSACAQLSSIGIPTPSTFNEKLVAGYSSVIEVRVTATALLTARKITSADATNVQTSADVARAGLDVARSLSLTDMSAAEGKLAAVRTTITALNAYLATRK